MFLYFKSKSVFPFLCISPNNSLWSRRQCMLPVKCKDRDIWSEDGTGRGEVLRWLGNRMGRPLSPPQIHQKNISTLSKFHKTTSECQQRTSGTQKSSSLSSKRGRKKYKDKKRDKRGREGAPSQEVSLKKREVSKHQETLSLPSRWWALEAQRAT